MTVAARGQASPAVELWPHVAQSMDRLLAVLGSLPDEGARRWRPPVEGARSVATLTTHLLGDLRRNLVGVMSGEVPRRDRLSELDGDPLSLAEAADEWARLRFGIGAVLGTLDRKAWRGTVRHDHRGALSRVELLFVAGRHVAEHLGQAELIRDLALAARADRMESRPPAEGG